MPAETNLRDTRIRHLDLQPAVCVDRGAPLATVIERLREQKSGSALVCEGGRVVGIFTERDLLRKVIGRGVDYDDPVDNFMSPDPASLTPDDLLGDAIRKMDEGAYRTIPLVDGSGKQVGLLSVRDVIRYIAEHFPREVLDLPPRAQQTFDTPEGA